MNTDITFCENKSCKIRKYCRRGVDIRDGDLLISYTDFDCLSHLDEGYNFFLDNNVPIIVYESNPKEVIEFAQWISLNCYQTSIFNLWIYLDLKKTTEELYKLYKDGKENNSSN